MAKTIFEIGNKKTNVSPVLVGVAEVENNRVLQNLITTKPLKHCNYGFIHYNSPDERGIDTALICRKDHFKVLHSEPIPIVLFNRNNTQDTTRDILYVKGKLNGETVHIFVNHWPSRRSGSNETNAKRVKAGETLKNFMVKIELETPNPNYIIMGDFNDGPRDESIKTLMNTKQLYNPMEKLITPNRGSATYKKTWFLFDQIIVSHNFLNYEKGTHTFSDANIFDKKFLTELKGKYKGTPYRTYAGKKYIGGYSDHFPVYIYLKYNA